MFWNPTLKDVFGLAVRGLPQKPLVVQSARLSVLPLRPRIRRAGTGGGNRLRVAAGSAHGGTGRIVFAARSGGRGGLHGDPFLGLLCSRL